MPELDITIGGRSFVVSCQAGEEPSLRAAAALLDAEAQPLVEAMGQMPSSRMLLLAGLLLADKMVALEQEITRLRSTVTELENRPVPEPEKIEVPVIPPQLTQSLADIAARAEALADQIEDQLS